VPEPILSLVVPLPWVAMGFVVLLLTAPLHGYDLLADPLGWLLVLGGLARLPLDPATRARLRALALLALAVSVLTWPGPVVHWLDRADDSLPWAVGLPEIAVAVVLCHDLADLARRAEDGRAARWFEGTRTLTLVAGLMPVLVLGGHLHTLAVPSAVAAVAAPAVLIVLLFRYAGRPWATTLDSLSDPGDRPDRTSPLL
jgi:hypothetical protein